MGQLADKRLGDFLPVVDAYRPVALTVAAILLLVAILPGIDQPEDSGPPEFAAFSPDDAAPTQQDGAATPAPTTTAAPGSPTPTTTPPPSFAPAPAPQSPPTTSSPPTTAASDPEPFVPDFSTDETEEEEEDEPFRIVVSGWASSTGGTPLSTGTSSDVPEGTLPVGTRVAQTDKISFIRLSGDDTTLQLVEDADGRRGSEFEASPVQACQITDAGWEGGEDQAMSDAPAHDAEACVPVQPQDDGTWTVSLFTFSDLDTHGIALVPTGDAPLDFQVTFASQLSS